MLIDLFILKFEIIELDEMDKYIEIGRRDMDMDMTTRIKENAEVIFADEVRICS